MCAVGKVCSMLFIISPIICLWKINVIIIIITPIPPNVPLHLKNQLGGKTFLITGESSFNKHDIFSLYIHNHSSVPICKGIWSWDCALQETITKIRNKYSQKWNWPDLFPVPTFTFRWAIYIFPRSVFLFCCRKIGGPIPHRSWICKLGLRPRSFF